MATPEAERLAEVARHLRRNARLRQLDLVRPGRSRHFIRQLESARAGLLRVDDVRAHFADLGARAKLDVYWQGARLDRLLDERRRAVFVGEIKSAWGSVEETNRVLDAKARLAPKVVFDRFGWRPQFVAKVLVLPEDSTARRVARKLDATLSATCPARARGIRAWLRKPDGSLAGLWFLSDVR